MVNKKTNKNFKKTIVVIGFVMVSIVLYIFLNKIECATCAFLHNDPNYIGYCPEMCYRAPRWKIILFEITGNNYGYKY